MEHKKTDLLINYLSTSWHLPKNRDMESLGWYYILHLNNFILSSNLDLSLRKAERYTHEL